MTIFDGIDSDTRLLVTGTGLQEANVSRERLFEPRLNNAYENDLYQQAKRKTRFKEWLLSRFVAEDFPRGSLPNPRLRAIDSAFTDALSSAGLLRKINKKLSSRTGFIYVDCYGITSSLERPEAAREVYYSDIFPTFLLQTHNINGFSVKVRGERNGTMQALESAFTLIQSGELDVVVLGGLFQIYPYLFLSESLKTGAWDKSYKVNGAIKNKKTEGDVLRERSMFIVLESEEHGKSRGVTPKMVLQEPKEYIFPTNAPELPALWKKEWLTLPEIGAGDTVYGGLYGAAENSVYEKQAMNSSFQGAKIVDMYKEYGDSGILNTLLPLHHHFQNTEGGESGSKGLIHSFDRSGLGWNAVFASE